MGLFRRKGKGDASDISADETRDLTHDIDSELQEQAQEVMKDNLELMKEVVMKIRDDPEFASNIYSGCPRLQHLLDQYPDLRPIFEDPKLVRINFEQVYRDAGGILPEDEAKKKSWLIWLVNSPFFKVLKLALFVKKVVGCIAGGGFAFISGCLMGCCFEDALEEVDGESDMDGDDAEFETDPAKEALNRAADHMENPEVQEHMQALLEDPDNLQEAIENDSELKALRDSNALCGELMSDPETMRVLVDPDNLRALGEAPHLIEADFLDPEGFIPNDIETGGFDGLGDAGYDGFDGGDMEFAEADGGFELEADADDGFEGEAGMEAEDDGFDDMESEGSEDEGWWEDFEMEEQDNNNNNDGPRNDGADRGDAGNDTKGAGNDNHGGNNQDAGNENRAANRGKNQARSQAKQQAQQPDQEDAGNGRFRGIMASIGVAATDLIAAQIVGNVMGDGMGFGGGGAGGGIDQIDEIADDAIDDDIADVAKDTINEADEKAKNEQASKSNLDSDMTEDDNGKKKAGAAAAGGAAAGGAVSLRSQGVQGKENQKANDSFKDEEALESHEETPEEEEEPKKKNRFQFVRNLASAISTAAKEHVASALLGDDFGEEAVERMDEKAEERKEAKEKAKEEAEKRGNEEDDLEMGEDKEKDGEQKRRGFFSRARKGKNEAE